MVFETIKINLINSNKKNTKKKKINQKNKQNIKKKNVFLTLKTKQGLFWVILASFQTLKLRQSMRAKKC